MWSADTFFRHLKYNDQFDGQSIACDACNDHVFLLKHNKLSELKIGHMDDLSFINVARYDGIVVVHNFYFISFFSNFMHISLCARIVFVAHFYSAWTLWFHKYVLFAIKMNNPSAICQKPHDG